MAKALSLNAARTAARLLAVQALYCNTYHIAPTHVLVEEARDMLILDNDGTYDEADSETLLAVLAGVKEHEDALIEVLSGALNPKLKWDRLDLLLRIIALSASFELLYRFEIPAGVIINDYTTITRAFWQGREVGLINGLLNAVSTRSGGLLSERENRV